MYSSERAKQIIKKDVAFLPAGIHDNVKLISVRADKSINDNNFIEFKFDKDGMGFTHTEYEPRKSDQDTEETYQDKCDKQFSRIEQILKCYYTDEKDREFSGENFVQFAKWVVEKLENAIKEKEILTRVKVVYNDNGYTTLPRYAKYTFIEPMSTVNEGKSMIVKLGIDNFERPVKADPEVNNNNPLEVVTADINTTVNTSTGEASDLPF